MHITRVPEKGRTAATTSLGASFNGSPYLLEHMNGFSIVVDVSGTSTAAGTFKLQASNNAFTDNVNGDTNSSATWVDISGSGITIVSGDTQLMWHVTDAFYEAVRVVWTRSSGTGTYTAYFIAKSEGN